MKDEPLETLGARINWALAHYPDGRKSQKWLAASASVTQQAVSQWVRNIAPPNQLFEVARILKVEYGWLKGERKDIAFLQEGLQPKVENANEIKSSHETIPVYGPPAGGRLVRLSAKNIVANIGTFTDHLRQYKSLFAINMIGNTMSPRHRHGELVRFAENTEPKAGEDCGVQLKNDDLIVAEFVRQTNREYILKTLKPMREISYSFGDVKAIHLVIR